MSAKNKSAVFTEFDHLDEAGRNERFKQIFQNAPDAVFLIVADGPDRGRIVAANAAAERMHQYETGELNGLTIMELDAPDAARDAPDRIRRLLSGEILTFEINHLRKDGSVFPVEVTASKIMIDDSPFILAFDREITDRKRVEAEHRNLQRQLLQSQKMEAVGQLAAGIAHEFNNILFSILANVEYLIKTHAHELPDHVLRPVREIENAGAKASALTKQLLSFVRKKHANISSFDLNQAVTDQIGLLEQLLGDGVDVRMNLDPSGAWVRADQAEIENALLNLCINARDAIDGNGEVEITTRVLESGEGNVPSDIEQARYVQLSVADNGCGISKDLHERIFEPFFTTKPVGKGTGLGLSIVFANVTNSEGFIRVESETGNGSEFQIYLPLAEVGETTRGDDKSNVLSTTRGAGELILVCDDDEMVLSSLSNLIESFGYRVLRAEGRTQAIEIAAEQVGEIAMLITDISMQKIDGVQLGLMLKELKPNMKVICVSGYGYRFIDSIRKAKFEFVEKPISAAKLSQLIHNTLNK